MKFEAAGRKKSNYDYLRGLIHLFSSHFFYQSNCFICNNHYIYKKHMTTSFGKSMIVLIWCTFWMSWIYESWTNVDEIDPMLLQLNYELWFSVTQLRIPRAEYHSLWTFLLSPVIKTGVENIPAIQLNYKLWFSITHLLGFLTETFWCWFSVTGVENTHLFQVTSSRHNQLKWN